MSEAANSRVLLLAVECHEGSAEACRWMVANLYRPGDQVHLVHILPRPEVAKIIAPGDLAGSMGTSDFDAAVHSAEAFMTNNIVPLLAPVLSDPVVHLIKAQTDSDSIGQVLCRKATDLGAVMMIMAHHHRSKVPNHTTPLRSSQPLQLSGLDVHDVCMQTAVALQNG